VFASVAMLTCWLQVWPWFRQRCRTAHRIAGRIYVFGGVLPAVAVTFPLGVFAPFGPVAQVSNLLLAEGRVAEALMAESDFILGENVR
jgi:hypothetical protein